MNTLIGQLKAKDAGRRKDWMKKTTTDLACRLDVIRVENLSITAMTRSARGTVQEPGSGTAYSSSSSQIRVFLTFAGLAGTAAPSDPGAHGSSRSRYSRRTQTKTRTKPTGTASHHCNA